VPGDGAVGLNAHLRSHPGRPGTTEESSMHGIIYLIGLVVVVLAILSLLGLG
jgi:hypothetical protein